MEFLFHCRGLTPNTNGFVGTLAAAAVGVVLGAITAWLSIGYSGFFIVLLPILAFGFGLRTASLAAMTGTAGLLVGNAIWLGWPFPDPEVFLAVLVGMILTGGIAIFVVAAAAGLLRTTRSPVRSGVASVVFIAFLAWMLFLACPRWSHIYQVVVKADRPVERVTLKLPMATLNGQPYTDLFRGRGVVSTSPDGTRVARMIGTQPTEYGEMLELPVLLEAQGVPGRGPVGQGGYEGTAFFTDFTDFTNVGSPPRADLELGQRQNVLSTVLHRFAIHGGPFEPEKSRRIMTYEVPVQASYEGPANIEVTVHVRTDVRAFVGLGRNKTRSRSDELVVREIPATEWVVAPATGEERISLSRTLPAWGWWITSGVGGVIVTGIAVFIMGFWLGWRTGHET